MTQLGSSLGITVNVHNPLVSASGHVRDYFREVSGYRHTISAMRGFDSAEVELIIPIAEIDEWVSNGIGRHVIVKGSDGAIAFDGFVNQIDTQYGTLRITRGPLMSITNLCYVIYAEVDASTDPPTTGDRTITTGAAASESQNKYGIIERVLSPGNMTQTEAEQVRDTFLADNSEPETGKSISIGTPGNVSIKITLLGYSYWLDAYLYTNSGVTGYVTASERIEAILDYDVNGTTFVSDTRFIESNGILVVDAEYDYPTAYNAIKAIVDLGDVNDNRYVFGVYEDRIPRYGPIPTDFEYVYRISDKFQEVLNISNDSLVPPWSIRPAKWLKVSDMITGTPVASSIYDDPRAVFIESISYTAPTTINIQHTRNTTLERKIAKISLGLGV